MVAHQDLFPARDSLEVLAQVRVQLLGVDRGAHTDRLCHPGEGDRSLDGWTVLNASLGGAEPEGRGLPLNGPPRAAGKRRRPWQLRIDGSPDEPVETWHAEGIEAALERGVLSDWRRVAAAVRSDPWGRVARVVEEISGRGELYGVDALMQRVVASARREVDAAARARYAGVVREARARTSLSLREFARLAGTSASRLCEYERARTAPTTEVLGRIEHVARRHAREAST